MPNEVIHALVLIQNWGEDSEILKVLKYDVHIISIFHVMGRHSYLIDANFDDKEQLSQWISRMKAVKLSSGNPAIILMQTQRIIDVHKQKEGFDLAKYLDLKEKYHFFVKIDNPHHDDDLLSLLKESSIVYSILQVQGESSFAIEIIVEDYNDFKSLLSKMKQLQTIHHIETQEVISVLKYRNQLLNEEGDLIRPDEDIRELFTL